MQISQIRPNRQRALASIDRLFGPTQRQISNAKIAPSVDMIRRTGDDAAIPGNGDIKRTTAMGVKRRLKIVICTSDGRCFLS